MNNKQNNSSTNNSSTHKRKNTRDSSTSTRKKQVKHTKLKTIDPIDAFNVFTSDDLQSITSSKTSSTLLQKTRINHLQSPNSDNSENDDFYPKSQSVRKSNQSPRKTKSTTTILKTTTNKVSRPSNDNKELTPPKTTNPVVLTQKSTTTKSTTVLKTNPKKVSHPSNENNELTPPKITNPVIVTQKRTTVLKTNPKKGSNPSNGNNELTPPKTTNPVVVTQKRTTTVLKTTPTKVSHPTNENNELTPPRTTNLVLTPKRTTKVNGQEQSSSSATLSKPFIEMRLNSPKKHSPNSTQQQNPKINILSSTVIKKPTSVQNSQVAGPSTAGIGKKISVCRNIFGTENPNKREINNTILKDYDVNVRICNKTLKGKINISDDKKVVSINLTDENVSMDTEVSSSCSELETPKKTTNYDTEKHSKMIETPTKSPKKIKPKDTKCYKQSSLLSFMGNPKPSTSKNIEIDKNKYKNNVVKANSKYTLKTNTGVYENVKNIMTWVFEKEYFSILFTKNETDLLDNFFKLSDTKLTILCLRLFTRQHKWYNLTNLCTELNLKDESYNYHDVLAHLDEVYVYSDYTDETIDVLLDHLSAGDLKDICNSFKINAPTRKEAMLRKLLDYTSRQCTLTFVKNSNQILRERIQEKLGICVKLKTEFKNILYMIHLLYSITNSFTTINDIYNIIYKIKSNTIKYPSVQTDATKIFADRKDFLTYTEATLLRKEYDDQVSKKDIGSQYLLCVEAHKRLLRLINDAQQVEYDTLKPLFLRRFSASWIYCKVLSNGSLNLGKHYSEQVCEWLTDLLKQDIYCLYKRGQWYIQLSLINQSHLKKFVEAADNIISGINDKDVTEITKYELSIRGSKIRKTKLPQLKFDELQFALLPNLTIPVERTFEAKSIYRNEQGRKLYFERITEEGKEYASVEETAINYYKENHNFPYGYHCEGRLLTTLFIIFFWDILYEMNIPNTFITELQSFPLDLFSTDFYVNRREKIDKRLKDIRNKWNLKEMCDFFSSKFTTYNAEINSIVSFECDNAETYHEIIQCIGNIILAAVFERLAKDYKQFHSGLPDLFLWNNREFKCGFVEVKSENDTLSARQILWIHYLHHFHATVEVCHVLNKGSKKLKKKACGQKI